MADLNLSTSSNDIIVDKVEIITASGRVEDLQAKRNYDLISIHENMFFPVITGSIQITDARNMFSDIGFNGSEFIRIEYKKPGEDFKYSKVFRIYSSTGRKPSEQNQSQGYVLHFCSEELIFSNQLSVSESFKNYSATNYVINILKSYLRVPNSKIKAGNFENSLGTTDFIFTNDAPLEAINTLAKYSYGFLGTPFLFFENNQGFNFKSLESLFAQPSINNLVYSTAKIANPAKDAAHLNSNDINQFYFDNSFDLYENTKKPTYSGTLYTLDLVRQKYSKADHSLVAQPNLQKSLLDGVLPAGIYPNRNNKTLFEEFGTNIKYSMTNQNQTNIPYALARGFKVNNTNVEKVLMQREMHLSLLENTKMRCVVPGNPNYTVGTIVDFTMPGFMQEDKTDRLNDPYHSGRYLITAVRHVITRSEGSQTMLILSKNSSGTKYDSANYNTNYARALAS